MKKSNGCGKLHAPALPKQICDRKFLLGENALNRFLTDRICLAVASKFEREVNLEPSGSPCEHLRPVARKCACSGYGQPKSHRANPDACLLSALQHVSLCMIVSPFNRQ